MLTSRQWWSDGWITKGCKEILGVGGNVCYLDCSDGLMGLHRSELIKLHSLNICMSLYVN